MKRLLLATIHGFYLQAMGRLPTSELCDSYHRSMLMGGHCYGPLDPVSNIIVNTIWYEHNFPASKQFPVAMISTTMLSCIVARSLYGLVSFLCTRYRGLTPDLAMQRLLVTGVSLRAADPNLSPTPSAAIKKRLDFSGCTQVLDNPDTSHIQKSVVEESTPSASVDESYIAAATAGFHGYPLAQQEFLASPTGLLSKLELVSEVLHIQVCVPGSQSASDGQLSPQKLSLLRTILQRCPSSTGKLHQQERIGVNELVSGPVRSLGEKVGDYNPWTLCKARLYDPPTLFFAECGKDGADTCWCVPVIPQKPEAGQVRCIYCEYQGNRILHPAMESFHGRNEFENLFYGSDGSYTNDKLITNSDLEVDWVHGVQDGAIYRDCYPDSDDDEDDWIDIF
uniref:Thyroglobulin type-1 domain-containing protein n=1 Tax=Oryza meridionalis TaxID=40149 RepID=A0A0E0E8T9_9ORYZ